MDINTDKQCFNSYRSPSVATRGLFEFNTVSKKPLSTSNTGNRFQCHLQACLVNPL